MEDKPLLTVAVSSRALFNFEEENKIFKTRGEAAYIAEQHKQLGNVPAPGVAFGLVKKLLALNDEPSPPDDSFCADDSRADDKNPAADQSPLVEVVVLSRNDPVTGLRVFRAIGENKLPILRGCFTRGAPSFPYLKAFGAQLFLSALKEDVESALDIGVAAAHIKGGDYDDGGGGELRIAFDGDAVLFGDESERVFQEDGLVEFLSQEKEKARQPMLPGPFKLFLDSLNCLRRRLPKNKIRTALITARGAPAHERPIRTLMEWGVEVDEAFFLAGKNKDEFLSAYRPDFFFDDQTRHLQGVGAAGHVPFGIKNAP